LQNLQLKDQLNKMKRINKKTAQQVGDAKVKQQIAQIEQENLKSVNIKLPSLDHMFHIETILNEIKIEIAQKAMTNKRVMERTEEYYKVVSDLMQHKHAALPPSEELLKLIEKCRELQTRIKRLDASNQLQFNSIEQKLIDVKERQAQINVK